jgi:hypothetical protein
LFEAVQMLDAIAKVPTPFRQADLTRELGLTKWSAGYWCDKFEHRYGGLLSSRYGYVWAWEVAA